MSSELLDCKPGETATIITHVVICSECKRKYTSLSGSVPEFKRLLRGIRWQCYLKVGWRCEDCQEGFTLQDEVLAAQY